MQKETQSIEQPSRPLPVATPAVNIYENRDEYLLHADVPGVMPDGVDIEFNRGELVLEARRPAGMNYGEAVYKRVFRFPEDVDASAIEAKLDHGVLALTLPKSPEVKPRKIAIH